MNGSDSVALIRDNVAEALRCILTRHKICCLPKQYRTCERVSSNEPQAPFTLTGIKRAVGIDQYFK